MSTLAWGLIILVLFPLLQIPILIYVSRRLEGDDADDDVPTPGTNYWVDPSDPQPMVSFDGGAPQSDVDTTTITCPQCGTENDPLYTYCRNCVQRLPTMGWE